MIRAEAPAERARMAGPVGERVMAWMRVPTGMSRMGRQFPGLIATERRIPRSIVGAATGAGSGGRAEVSMMSDGGGRTDWGEAGSERSGGAREE